MAGNRPSVRRSFVRLALTSAENERLSDADIDTVLEAFPEASTPAIVGRLRWVLRG